MHTCTPVTSIPLKSVIHNSPSWYLLWVHKCFILDAACTAGHYKPENGSAECLPCPPSSIAVQAAAEHCSCLDGYFRVASDPADVGCTSKSTSQSAALQTPHGQ